MNPAPRATKVLPGLILAGIIVLLARSVSMIAYQRYVIEPSAFNFTNPSASGLPLEALYLGSSVISFAFFPCAVFVAVYFLGGRIKLEDDWRSPAVSLFAAGALATVLDGTVIDPLVTIALSGSDAPSVTSGLEALLGSGWNIASLAFYSVEEGLFLALVGVAAVYITSRRTGASPTPLAGGEEVGPLDSQGPP